VNTTTNLYTFPLNEKRGLRFQHKRLMKYNWLPYLEQEKEGAFCKYCTIFTKVGGKKRPTIGLLS